MVERKYVMVKLEVYEELVEIGKREPSNLLRRLYGQLTGNCFIDKNEHWDIDHKRALEAAEELWGLLGTIENLFIHPPYDEDVYTKSERKLLDEILVEREDWD